MRRAFFDSAFSFGGGADGGDIAVFFSELADRARLKTFAGSDRPIHALVSDDIVGPARKALLDLAGVKVTEADFTDISAIDRAVRKNTFFAYCEYPSAALFRTFDFAGIHEFLSYFKIELACGFFFADPRFCNSRPPESAGAPPPLPEGAKTISRCAANARRLAEKLSRRAGLDGITVVRPSSSNTYADYKNHRGISRVDGSCLLIRGRDDRQTAAAAEVLRSALGPAGLVTGELGEDDGPYRELAGDISGYRLYTARGGRADGAGGLRLILKSGTDETALEGL